MSTTHTTVTSSSDGSEKSTRGQLCAKRLAIYDRKNDPVKWNGKPFLVRNFCHYIYVENISTYKYIVRDAFFQWQRTVGTENSWETLQRVTRKELSEKLGFCIELLDKKDEKLPRAIQLHLLISPLLEGNPGNFQLSFTIRCDEKTDLTYFTRGFVRSANTKEKWVEEQKAPISRQKRAKQTQSAETASRKKSTGLSFNNSNSLMLIPNEFEPNRVGEWFLGLDLNAPIPSGSQSDQEEEEESSTQTETTLVL